MSYLPPTRWWMWLLRPFARCQRKPLHAQIKSGVKVFDLRIFRDKNLRWQFAHGIVSFERADFWRVIAALPDGAIVRLILERSSGEDDEECFKTICMSCELEKRLTFIGGRRKKGWKLLYDFEANKTWSDDKVFQHVGSMASDARWYEKILPWAYARRTQGKHISKSGINLYDFV